MASASRHRINAVVISLQALAHIRAEPNPTPDALRNPRRHHRLLHRHMRYFRRELLLLTVTSKRAGKRVVAWRRRRHRP